MIRVNDITACETNEETMIGLITVKLKDINNTVVDKVIKGNANIGEVLAISKEVFENEVKEKSDIINDEVVEEMKFSDINVKNDYHDGNKEVIHNNKSNHSTDSTCHEENNIMSNIQETALIKALGETNIIKLKTMISEK